MIDHLVLDILSVLHDGVMTIQLDVAGSARGRDRKPCKLVHFFQKILLLTIRIIK